MGKSQMEAIVENASRYLSAEQERKQTQLKHNPQSGKKTLEYCKADILELFDEMSEFVDEAESFVAYIRDYSEDFEELIEDSHSPSIYDYRHLRNKIEEKLNLMITRYEIDHSDACNQNGCLL